MIETFPTIYLNAKKIAPSDDSSPLVTFILLAYRQEPYVRAALASVLAQTYSPLQIVVADDCSADGTFEIISSIVRDYRGPHEVVVLRQERNLGLIGNLNRAMAEARGDLIVYQGGDDISTPDRVQRVVAQWLANGRESGSLFSRFKVMDESGRLKGHADTHEVFIRRLTTRNRETLDAVSVGTCGCAHAWTRDVFDIFGPIDERAIHEDISIPLRSLLIGSITFMPDELVQYRVIQGSLSRMTYRGHRERMSKMARYWEGRAANFRQFSEDVSLALELKLASADDVAWFVKCTASSAETASLNWKFFSGDFLERLVAVGKASTGVPLGRRFKLLLLAFFPWLYGFRSG